MIPDTFPYDGVFDADFATVQRSLSIHHITGRDVVSVEDALLALAAYQEKGA